ncbi:Flp pilus assembly complex ATPase component TadA [Candidatus Falkowbacteria bacterium]|jgi:type IV pilus assembly protein PilB|nr:Flp pilus assembly complex ATPase component TadA [Candidatus Falkowbacteria bacterium]
MSKKIISNIFNYASQEGAKDIIIEKLPKKININYLFPDKETRSFSLPAKLEEDFRKNLQKVLALAPDDLVTQKYCKLKNKTGYFNFYLTILSSADGDRLIINLIPKKQKLFSLRQLGLKSSDVKALQAAAQRHSGLILISSPDNQGKSSTLYALLREIDAFNRSSYFLGESFEHYLDGINYLADTKNNWNKVLDLDSDVIITEITQEKSLYNAFLAASSGRLVLATIKANSVWEVMLTVLRLNLPLTLKLNSLLLITGQRIVPLKRTKSKSTRKKINNRQDIGLFEVLNISPAIKKFIIKKEKDKKKENFWEDLVRLALKTGYEPLSYDKKSKIKNGVI